PQRFAATGDAPDRELALGLPLLCGLPLPFGRAAHRALLRRLPLGLPLLRHDPLCHSPLPHGAGVRALLEAAPLSPPLSRLVVRFWRELSPVGLHLQDEAPPPGREGPSGQARVAPSARQGCERRVVATGRAGTHGAKL